MATTIPQNKSQRAGVGLRARDPERAAPGYTLFAPLQLGEGRVLLIDPGGNVMHCWDLPYPPGLDGYLSDRGTLVCNGQVAEDSLRFLSKLRLNGNLLIFDNGTYRVDSPFPYSRVIEVNPATGDIVWQYRDHSPTAFYSTHISSAQRLPNGNTLIDGGCWGRFFEVTSEGEIVWEYVNPYFGATPGVPLAPNAVFRAYRYLPEEIARARATVG